MKRIAIVVLAVAALTGCFSMSGTQRSSGSLAGTSEEQAYIQAARNGNLVLVVESLEAGIDINLDYGSGTALMVASFNGHLEVVQYLLDHGADVFRTNNGATAYDLAGRSMNQKEAHAEIRKLLKEKME